MKTKTRKIPVTIQLPPMLKARIWQWGKDQGIAYQVACQNLIEHGFRYLESKKDENTL
jgi:hypothetical protein